MVLGVIGPDVSEAATTAGINVQIPVIQPVMVVIERGTPSTTRIGGLPAVLAVGVSRLTRLKLVLVIHPDPLDPVVSLDY